MSETKIHNIYSVYAHRHAHKENKNSVDFFAYIPSQKKDKAGLRNHQAMCVFCLLMCLPFKLSSQNLKKLGMNIVRFEDTQIPFRRDKLSTSSDQNVTDTRMSELLASLVSLTVRS